MTNEDDNKKKTSNEGLKLGSEILEALAKFQQVELEDFQMDLNELQIVFEPSATGQLIPKIKVPGFGKPTAILPASFDPPVEICTSKIAEVKLGATKSEGGTRRKSITIGGEASPTFYTFERPIVHKPVVTLDVFDMAVPLAKAVKMHVEDVIGDPAAWAKLAVEKFDADMVTIHLISVDPLLKDAKPQDAVKTVERVLQAVDVPLVIGGCGDAVKDADVFEAICNAFPGERFLISSITGDMDIERVAKCVKKNGHAALAFSPMDLNLARELNRRLYDFLDKEDIVVDLTTAALGYGLEYSFTNMEHARLGSLMGDSELAHPMSSGTTNSWAAREAWLKMPAEWEPRELRGPLWELTTAITLLLAGVDLFMMMHPAAVKTMKDITSNSVSGQKANPLKYPDWVTVKA